MPAPGRFPRVSVALCTYNSAAYLTEQLQSIAEQTLCPDELVVADDGSTDETLAIVEQFAARFTAAVVITGRQQDGVAGNFARALEAASGDVILLSDHDDVWEPTKVAELVAAIGAGPAMVFTDATLIDATGETLPNRLWESLRFGTAERAAVDSGTPLQVLLRRNVVTGATAAVTSALVKRALPVPPGWLHDEWLAMVAAVSGRLVAVDTPLTRYRQHGANQVGVSSPTARARLRRMFASAPDRHTRQALRIERLHERLTDLGADVATVARVEAKLRFERARAAYPATRILRVGRIVRQLRYGAYATFASQGRVDAIRDLLVR